MFSLPHVYRLLVLFHGLCCLVETEFTFEITGNEETGQSTVGTKNRIKVKLKLVRNIELLLSIFGHYLTIFGIIYHFWYKQISDAL